MEQGWLPQEPVTEAMATLFRRHIDEPRTVLAVPLAEGEKVRRVLFGHQPSWGLPTSTRRAQDRVVFDLSAHGREALERGELRAFEAFAHQSYPGERPPPPEKIRNEARFTFVELFAGIGGFRVALERVHGHCLFACEKDAEARKVYSANFPNAQIAADIRSLDCRGYQSPDLLVAGMPCQSFSNIGQQKGFADANGLLFFQLVRVARELQPRAVLLENVPGLARLEALHTVVAALQHVGYRVQWRIFCCGGALLAQDRRRFILVAHRCDLSLAPFLWPQLPSLKLAWRHVYRSQDDDDDSLRLRKESAVRDAPWRLKKFPNSVDRRIPVVSLSPDALTRTLVSSYRSSFAMHAQFVPLSDGSFRFFSPREFAACQGFPRDFTLSASIQPNRIYSQLGNAIPPPLVGLVAVPLLRSLNVSVDAQHSSLGETMALEALAKPETDPSDRL